jgi:flagellar biosynthesis GTPase FlhF
MPPQVNVKRFSRAKVDPEMPPAPIVTRKPNPGSAPVIQKKRVTLPPVKEESESESESESDSESDSESSDDELEQLTRTKYVSKVALEKNMKAQKEQEKEAEKERKKMEKEEEKQQKKLEKAQKDAEKAAEKAQKNAEKEATKKVNTEESALFSKKGSELYGRDKLELIAKFNQFKVLFPDNKKLQALKMKKNCTVDELQQYLA